MNKNPQRRGFKMGIIDNLRLSSYIAAANAYDESKNIFHGFLPMIETALLLSGEQDVVSFLALQKQINDAYQVRIPKTTLRYLLQVLQDHGKIRFEKRRNIFINKREELKKQDEIGRNATEDFFLLFGEYLEKKGKTAFLPEIREKICLWVYYNSWDLAQFIDIGTLPKDFIQNDALADWPYYNDFISFLIESRDGKTQAFSSFVKIFDGAVQTSLLNFSPEEIQQISDKNFAIDHIILDTNFILRLMGLQPPMDNESAIATWECLHSNGAEFFVLLQTVQEASKSIKAFLQEIGPNTQKTHRMLSRSKIYYSGFLSAFQNGVSRTQFLECSNTETIIAFLQAKFNVQVIDDYDTPSIAAEEINSLVMSKNTASYGEAQAIHDLTLISYCRGKRNNRIDSFSDVRWWILTNDRKLTYWNQNNCGEYQECITEIQLSNLLWLLDRKDNSGGLVNTILAIASRFAITPSDVSAFSKQIVSYQCRNAGSPAKIDKLALIFAGGILTEDDIRLAAEDEESFDKVIEEHADIIIKQQDEQKKQLTDSQEKQESLAQEIAELKLKHAQEMEDLRKHNTKEKLEEKSKNLSSKIKEIEKEIAAGKNLMTTIEELIDYSQSIEKPVGRTSVLILAVPIVCTLILFGVFALPPLIGLLKQQIAIMNGVFSIISGGILLACIVAIYYLVVGLIFGSLHKPRDIFSLLKSKRMLQKKKKYVIQHQYNWELINRDSKVLLEEQRLTVEENSGIRDQLVAEQLEVNRELEALSK